MSNNQENFKEKLLIRLDDDSDPSDDEDIFFVREKPNKKPEKIPITKLQPVNPFINSSGKDTFLAWGEDSEISESEKTKLMTHSQRTHLSHDPNSLDREEVISISEDPRGRKSRRRSQLLIDHEGIVPLIERQSSVDFNIKKDDEHQAKLNIRAFTREEISKFVPKGKFLQLLYNIRNFFSNLNRITRRYINPFDSVTRQIETSFGTGIASFYELWAYLIYMNVAIFFTHCIFLIIPWLFKSDCHAFSGPGVCNNGNFWSNFWAKFQPFFSIDFGFFLGLIGIETQTIGKTFFFFGGYENQWRTNTTILYNYTIGNVTFNNYTITNSTYDIRPFSHFIFGFIPFEFRFFYPLSIVVVFLVCLCVLVVSIGSRFRESSIYVDKHMKFSTAILSLWDHSLSSKHAVESQKRMISSTFYEFMQLEKQKTEEKKWIKATRTQICLLALRRIIGFVVSITIIIGGSSAIVLGTTFYKELNSTFSYTTTIIFSAMNLIFPAILDLMVRFEKYSNTKVENYQKVIRTYILKIFFLLSYIIRILFLFTEDGVCAPNSAAGAIWQMIILDLFSGLSGAWIMNYILYIINKRKKKSEFSISSAINRITYRQCVIWIGSIVSPVLPLLAVFTSVILFYSRSFTMFKTMRFPVSPVANARKNVFNQIVLLVGFFFTIIPTVVLFFLPQNGFKCGPAYEKRLYDGFKIWTLYPNSQIVNFLTYMYDYAPVAVGACFFVALIALYLAWQRKVSYQKKFERASVSGSQERTLWEKSFRDGMKMEREKVIEGRTMVEMEEKNIELESKKNEKEEKSESGDGIIIVVEEPKDEEDNKEEEGESDIDISLLKT